MPKTLDEIFGATPKTKRDTRNNFASKNNKAPMNTLDEIFSVNKASKPIGLTSLDLGSSGREEAKAAARKNAAMQKYVAGESSIADRLNATLDSRGLLNPKNTVKGYKSGIEIDAGYGRTPTTGTVNLDYIFEKTESAKSAKTAAQTKVNRTKTRIGRGAGLSPKTDMTAAGDNLTAAKAAYDSANRERSTAKGEAIRTDDLNRRAAIINDLEMTARRAPDFATGYSAGRKNNEKMFADISKGEDGNYYYLGMQSKKNARINYMTEAEKNVYAYWLSKDKDIAEDYYDALSTALNHRYQTDENAQLKRISEQAPALGVAANVIGSFASPVALAGTVAHNVGDFAHGEETPIDPNSAMFAGAHIVDASAEGIKEHTKTALGDFLVDTGLSMAQFASKIPLGALALPMMASGAGGQTALEVTQRGGTAKQALGMGLLSAAAEYFTEKMSFDSLLSIYKNGGRGFKNAFQAAAVNVGKQAKTEFAEELTSEILNNISDELIMGDNSQMQNYIDNLLSQGYSKEEALRKAATQFWVINPLLAGAGGALSGGVIGTIGSAAGNYRQGKIDTQSGAEMRNVWGSDFDAALDEIIATGQEYSDTTGAGYYADKAKAFIDGGKGLTDKQVGQLYRNVVHTQAQEAEAYFNGEMPRDPMRRDAEGYLTLPMPWQVSEYQIQKQQYQYAQKLAQNLRQYGVKNIVVEHMPEGESGRWENGTVYVSSKLDTAQAINTKVAHEISHAAKEGDAAFTTDVIMVMSEAGRNIDTAIGKKLQTYQDYWRAKGKSEQWVSDNITEEYAADEVVADYIGELMQDDTELRALAKRPNIVRRLIDTIDLLIHGKSEAEKNSFTVLADKLRSVAGVEQTAESGTEREQRFSFEGYDEETGKGIYRSNYPIGTPKAAKSQRILELVQDMWSEKPLNLVVTEEDGNKHTITAQFDPTYDESEEVFNDVDKLMKGSKRGTAADRRVTLDLADDYYKILSDAKYSWSQDETGKGFDTHKDVSRWHYFINNILFREYGSDETTPYNVIISVKEKTDGDYVYSFQAQKRNLSTPRTFSAGVNQAENGLTDTQVSNNSIRGDEEKINNNFSEPRYSLEQNGMDDTQQGEIKAGSEEYFQQRQADLDEYWNMVNKTADVTSVNEIKETTPEDLVAAEYLKTKQNFSEKTKEAWYHFKRRWVDSGEAVSRVGKALGDDYLYAYYNMARASSNAGINMIVDSQTDISGKRIGTSLNDIFGPIRATGDDYYKSFELYMWHLHNMDRMSRRSEVDILAAKQNFEQYKLAHPEFSGMADYQIENLATSEMSYADTAKEYIQLRDVMRKAERTTDKPVFSYDVTAADSAAESEKLLREHPEFAKLRDQVYTYIDNLMRYRVQSGLISEDELLKLKSIYPHYVPTYRVINNDTAQQKKRNNVQIGKTIGRAVGGTENLLPLHQALAQQTMSVVREGSKNRFGLRLMENENIEKVKEHVYDITEYQSDFSEDTFDSAEDLALKKTNTFVVRDNGTMWELHVSPALYEAVKTLSPDPEITSSLTKLCRAGNSLFKELVTGYNPMFLARNFMRDAQDAGFYSKHLRKTAAAYPVAWKEIATNGEYWQMYKALGGTYTTIFDYDTGSVDEGGWLKKNTLGRIETLNQWVEQAPRLAEFMATVKSGDGSYDNLMKAMHDSADVTVNFGRSGTIGKKLNANFVPFLNPGIQGFDKMARSITETKGLGPWLKLTAKAVLFGILPRVLNELLYRDDDEWKDIKDRDKSIYYLFKLKDGVWLKLPKGRTFAAMSLTEAAIENLAKGKEVNFLDYIREVGTQIAPANPLESNILAAWFDAKLFDMEDPGETWYGSDIESERLQNYAPGERYDEKTDIISKWLGGKLGLSPKKINYIIDQYTGVVGDVLLPLLTPQAERDPFTAAFTIDSVSSNRLSGEFYNTLDELTYAKNTTDADGSDVVVYRYWNKQNSLISDINKAIREIELDTTLSNKEKRELANAQKAIRNEIERNALDKLEEYRQTATEYYYKAHTGDEDDDIDYAYRMANKEVFGAEYALSVYNSKVYEKAKALKSERISFDDFFDVYFEDYKVLSDDEEMKSQEKSTKFISRLISKGYNTKKVTAFAETLKFYSSFAATTAIERYQSMTNSGVTSDAAEKVLTAVSGLEPEVGEDKVSELQKLRAIADQDITESEKVLAVESISKSSYTRVKLVSDYGIEIASYVSFLEALPKYDKDGNGSYKQAEVRAALDADRSLTSTQKAVLFQIKTRAKKGRNNPYSSATGAQVEDVLKAESMKKEKESDSAKGKNLDDIFGGTSNSHDVATPAPANSGQKTLDEIFG